MLIPQFDNENGGYQSVGGAGVPRNHTCRALDLANPMPSCVRYGPDDEASHTISPVVRSTRVAFVCYTPARVQSDPMGYTTSPIGRAPMFYSRTSIMGPERRVRRVRLRRISSVFRHTAAGYNF